MPASYTQARIEVERLVNQFARLSAHNRKRYNGAATRQAFILPLFDALGWNTRDTREVSPEEQVSRGFVDFAFRIQGIPRFFLETKKIPADLDDPRWAQQAINYAWLKAQPDRPALLPDDLPETLVDGERLSEGPWAFGSAKGDKILRKIDSAGVVFGQICERMFQGLVTSADQVYILDAREVDKSAGLVTAYSREQERTYKLETDVTEPLLKGSLHMRRYRIEEVSRYVIFPYQNSKLIPPEEFAARYPN